MDEHGLLPLNGARTFTMDTLPDEPEHLTERIVVADAPLGRHVWVWQGFAWGPTEGASVRCAGAHVGGSERLHGQG